MLTRSLLAHSGRSEGENGVNRRLSIRRSSTEKIMRPENAPRGELAGTFHEIHLAARNRNVAEVKRLLAAGTDVNLREEVLPNGDGGNTPLWFASQGPKPNGKEVAEVLIEAGAEVNAVCEHGTTAAHLACSWGDADVLELLYANGADLTLKDNDGMTPEMTARKGYDWQLTKVSDDQRTGVIGFFDRLKSK